VSERNPITVFASHVFVESLDYLRVFEFLESVDRFFYINVSKPENVPKEGGLQAIRDELIEQIKASEAVFILSDTYAQNPQIVEFMIDVADANEVATIGVRPFGAVSEIAPLIADRCAAVVEWNDREIADTVLLLARGQDTQRWDVLDFPGFDADGPTD
jgi:hypothetical protein